MLGYFTSMRIKILHVLVERLKFHTGDDLGLRPVLEIQIKISNKRNWICLLGNRERSLDWKQYIIEYQHWSDATLRMKLSDEYKAWEENQKSRFGHH